MQYGEKQRPFGLVARLDYQVEDLCITRRYCKMTKTHVRPLNQVIYWQWVLELTHLG